MTNSGAFLYARLEVLRALRSRRFFLFTLAFPLIIYLSTAVPNRHVTDYEGTGVSLPLYYMASMSSFGTMMAMISSGTRIANERQAGWTRQLRITPLSVRAYFRGKVVASYLMAMLTVALLYIAGGALGVSMPAGRWLEMTGLIIVGLLPFAALGILAGHLLSVDSIGPATGGAVALLAFISGVWFPITHGFLYHLARVLPSYWLAQAGRVASTGHGWGGMGWAVVAIWTVVLAGGARFAYQRDAVKD